MRNKQLLIMIEIGILSSIGLILDYFSSIVLGFAWPNGGSIGIAMVVVFVIAFRRGYIPGLLTGLIVGLLQLLYAGNGFLNIVQAFFDYYGAYCILGIAGLANRAIQKQGPIRKAVWMSLAMFVAGMLRFLLHTASGVWFWSVNWWGSILYNAGYMIPSIVLSILVVLAINKLQPSILFPDESQQKS